MSGITTDGVTTVAAFIEGLRETVSEAEASPEDVGVCVEATRRRFRSVLGESIEPRTRTHVRAYFNGVVRRQAMRSRGPRLSQTRRVLILTSLAEDLAAVFASEERIVGELREVYPADVPLHVVRRITRDVVAKAS